MSSPNSATIAPELGAQRLVYTPKMLADEIGVTTSTLRAWRSRRVGPRPTPVGTGNSDNARVVYRITDIIAWLDRQQASQVGW